MAVDIVDCVVGNGDDTVELNTVGATLVVFMFIYGDSTDPNSATVNGVSATMVDYFAGYLKNPYQSSTCEVVISDTGGATVSWCIYALSESDTLIDNDNSVASASSFFPDDGSAVVETVVENGFVAVLANRDISSFQYYPTTDWDYSTYTLYGHVIGHYHATSSDAVSWRCKNNYAGSARLTIISVSYKAPVPSGAHVSFLSDYGIA